MDFAVICVVGSILAFRSRRDCSRVENWLPLTLSLVYSLRVSDLRFGISRLRREVVRSTGFEPVTYGFVDHRSIQLSYERIMKFQIGIIARTWFL